MIFKKSNATRKKFFYQKHKIELENSEIYLKLISKLYLRDFALLPLNNITNSWKFMKKHLKFF